MENLHADLSSGVLPIDQEKVKSWFDTIYLGFRRDGTLAYHAMAGWDKNGHRTNIQFFYDQHGRRDEFCYINGGREEDIKVALTMLHDLSA